MLEASIFRFECVLELHDEAVEQLDLGEGGTCPDLERKTRDQLCDCRVLVRRWNKVLPRRASKNAGQDRKETGYFPTGARRTFLKAGIGFPRGEFVLSQS